MGFIPVLTKNIRSGLRLRGAVETDIGLLKVLINLASPTKPDLPVERPYLDRDTLYLTHMKRVHACTLAPVSGRAGTEPQIRKH